MTQLASIASEVDVYASCETLIKQTVSIVTTACIVAVAGCDKTDTPAPPAPTVVAKPKITELHQIQRYMGVDETRPDKPVTSVMLSNHPTTDAALEHLKGLTDIQVLGLNNTGITDAGLVHLRELTSLEHLYLQNNRGKVNQISDSGLEHLKGLTKLWSLNLENTQVTDAGLANLKGMTELRFLRLSDTQVTEEGLRTLKEALPNCQILF